MTRLRASVLNHIGRTSRAIAKGSTRDAADVLFFCGRVSTQSRERIGADYAPWASPCAQLHITSSPIILQISKERFSRGSLHMLLELRVFPHSLHRLQLVLFPTPPPPPLPPSLPPPRPPCPTPHPPPPCPSVSVRTSSQFPDGEMITRLFPLLVVSPLCVDVFGAPISYESYGFSPRKVSGAPPPSPPWKWPHQKTNELIRRCFSYARKYA